MEGVSSESALEDFPVCFLEEKIDHGTSVTINRSK